MKKLLLFMLITAMQAKVHMLTPNIDIVKAPTSWIEIKNKNLTRQKEDFSCGSASLATILKHYYGQNISEKEILDAVMDMKGLSKESTLKEYKEANGLSFLDLSQFAFSKGFKAVGLALDMEALKKLKVPVILYVKIRNDEHFTVYKGMDSTYAYLADPSFGNTKVRLSKFKEMFYQRDDLKYPGKVLVMLPTDKKISGDQDFLKIPKKSNLIEKVIRMRQLKS